MTDDPPGIMLDERAAQENVKLQQHQQMVYEKEQEAMRNRYALDNTPVVFDDIPLNKRICDTDDEEEEQKKGYRAGPSTPRTAAAIKNSSAATATAGSKFGERGIMKKLTKAEIKEARDISTKQREEARKLLDQAELKAQAEEDAEEADALNSAKSIMK